MKINLIKKFVVLAVMSAMVLIQSCQTDPDPLIKAGEAGFFIVNEGGYPNPNTSISFYDRKTDAVTNDLFIPLGIQAQSMTVFEGKGYILVQVSHKIVVVNTDDYSSIATISDGITNPRYFVGISPTKAYVSDWGVNAADGSVKVLDLTTYKVTKTIATGQGTNKMLKVGNLVYVTNMGGYGNDKTIKIIDSTTDAIVSTITTGDNPNSLQKDKDGNIWITTGGILKYNADFSINEAASTKGAIIKIKADNTEAFRLPVGVFTYNYPNNLNISAEGTQLYYTYNGAIYSMSTSATALPTAAFKTKNYYGLAVDPINGNIIGCDAGNFSSAGSIDIYSASGSLVKTLTVGIAPNGCVFK